MKKDFREIKFHLRKWEFGKKAECFSHFVIISKPGLGMSFLTNIMLPKDELKRTEEMLLRRFYGEGNNL